MCHNNLSSGPRRDTGLSSKQCQGRRENYLKDFFISEAEHNFPEALPTPDQFGNLESSTWIPWHTGYKGSVPELQPLRAHTFMIALTGLGNFSFNRPTRNFAVVLIQCLGFILAMLSWALCALQKAVSHRVQSFHLRCVKYRIHSLQKGTNAL